MTKPKPKTDQWGIVRGERWPLEKIRPYPRNSKTHPPAQVTLLAQIFKKYGPDQDIVVDEDRVILKGHGRLLAAYEAKMGEYPVTQRFGMSDADKRAMRIADNQLPLLGAWDNALVQAEISELKLAGYDVQLLGFGEAQLVHFETTPGPPSQFPTFDENIPTAHQCPQCGYKWSGSSVPAAEPEKKPAKAKAESKKKK